MCLGKGQDPEGLDGDPGAAVGGPGVEARILQVGNEDDGMDAMTVQEAQADLERLIGQVVEDVDPLILCNSSGRY